MTALEAAAKYRTLANMLDQNPGIKHVRISMPTIEAKSLTEFAALQQVFPSGKIETGRYCTRYTAGSCEVVLYHTDAYPSGYDVKETIAIVSKEVA